MKFTKSVFPNIIFIATISIIYSFLFLVLSGHIEYIRITNRVGTLDSSFWNFIKNAISSGNIKLFTIPIIILAIIIIIIYIIKRRLKYDEFQQSIILKSLAICGIIMVISMPVILVLVLSDKNYAIEVMFLFSFIQWIGILISELVFALKY